MFNYSGWQEQGYRASPKITIISIQYLSNMKSAHKHAFLSLKRYIQGQVYPLKHANNHEFTMIGVQEDLQFDLAGLNEVSWKFWANVFDK